MRALFSVRRTLRSRVMHASVLVVSALVAAACVARHATGAQSPAARDPVHYAIAIPDPAAQYVHVALRVADPRGTYSDVSMPAWAPGSYRIRDFARHVYDLHATGSQGGALAVTRRDKQTWRVHHGGQPFSVSYRVFAAEVGVRTSHVDDQHASLVGTSILMYLQGELQRPATVEITPPDGWRVHVALPATTTADGHVTLRAADYDALVDAPVEMGTPHVESFSVAGTAVQYVLTGADTLPADPARLAADAEKIVTAYATLMGGLPMSRYLFLVEASVAGGGGLEHANCASLALRPDIFASPQGYLRAAHLTAHEFFHAWNVKRIHDRALDPLQYAREHHSRLLWFHEGFTETMEGLAMLRAGLLSPEDHLQALANAYTNYLALPGRDYDPLSQLSFEAWVKGYQPAANHRNVAVSYYTKGDLVGVALDLELRLRSGGTGSLPGLFRRLMASHGARDRGITAADIVDAASAEAGEAMGWFFARYVEGTEALDLAPLLRKMGIDVHTQPGAGVFTGLRLDGEGTVEDVEADSPAADAGVMRGDRILAVDGHRADARAKIEMWLDAAGAGTRVRLTLFRAERLVESTLDVVGNPHPTVAFSLAPSPSPAVAAMRNGWLAGPSPAKIPAAAATATSD